MTVAIIGALGLVLAAGAVIAFRGDAGDGTDLRVSAFGPAPADMAAQAAPPPAPPNQPPAGEVPPEATPTTAVDSLSVTRVHPRAAPDDPVVRPPATDPSGTTSSPILPPPQSTTVVPGAALTPCPPSEVRVTVATDRAAYAPGQTVQGSSTLENRSGSACLLPTRAFFRIVNSAGKDVSGFAYTLEFRMPVRAEPGKTFTSTFTWDQKDCAGPACVQAPPGTYTVAAEWTESGPYTGSTTFQITA